MPPHCDLLSTITLGSFPGRKRAPSTTSGLVLRLQTCALKRLRTQKFTASFLLSGVPSCPIAQGANSAHIEFVCKFSEPINVKRSHSRKVEIHRRRAKRIRSLLAVAASLRKVRVENCEI
jgi:hypothetical protein